MVRITEEAYKIAYDIWGGDSDGEDPEYSVGLFGLEDHGNLGSYTFYLRKLVTESAQPWATTLDIVHVNAVTGQCTYSPGVLR